MLFGTIAALACVAILPGCEPAKPAMAATTVPSTSPATDQLPAPVPEGARDDPPVAASRAAGDAFSASLSEIHMRIRNTVASYRDMGPVAGDLRAASVRLRPLIASARADCDAFRRAAKDLKVQLPIAQAGYVTAAASYRKRAEGYRDPSLRSMTLGFAAQFDALAADTPRRLELTDRFLAHLDEDEGFLSEADRCLRDAETALAVFSGGGHAPEISDDARSLAVRLGEFVSVVLEYEEALLQPPGGPSGNPKGVPAGPKMKAEARPTSAPPRATSDRPQVSSTSSDQPGSIAAQVAHARTTSTRTVFPAGARLSGEITTPSHGFRSPVVLEILERDGDAFAGIVHYSGGYALGRRGVRGRVSPDGTRLSFAADWYEGNLSPEAIRYDLEARGGGFAGYWATASLEGTIRLAPPST